MAAAGSTQARPRPADGDASCRQRLAEGREQIRATFNARPNPGKALAAQCRLVDEILRVIWTDSGQPPELALVAVGGYGRGLLFPYSDVDVLILLPHEIDSETGQSVERLIGMLWDVGLEIGHSVRTIDQCKHEARLDVTVCTTLLESRLIAGNARLYGRFEKSIAKDLDLNEFVEAKLLEQQQRHGRFNDTAHNLEPNIKESPGGLRDLQNILWISRAAGLGRHWAELTDQRILTREELRQLKRHEAMLGEMRIRLHYLVGRREDRLLFDHQATLAAEYGLKDTKAKRASEQLMQRFYTTAKAVTLLNRIILQNLRGRIFGQPDAEPRPLNERFQIRGELLETRGPGVFQRNPSSLLEVFLLWQRYDKQIKGLSVGTMRALWHARDLIDARFRKDPAHRRMFMDLLRHPTGLTHALRRMNQYGILGRYLPVFGRIVGQMQHDLFHVYTVDEHILMVVRNLRRFTVPEMSHEYPLCSRLISEFDAPEVLYLAGLFHDIAKGRGGDHSTLGMADAQRFCRDHGLSADDTALVVWLVEHHLYMSAVAQKQDLSDPDVIAAFLEKVGTERRLVALYLLTVADIRGTSPKVWNAWKAKLLEDLFRATRRQLIHGTESSERTLEAKQSRVLTRLRAYAIPEDAHLRFWQKLDDSYFLRHDEMDIVWHTRLLNYRADSPAPIVKARLSPLGEGLQVMIYSPDARNLFARICGFFHGINYSIVEAKIYTTRHGYALDSFQVFDPAHSTSHYRDVISYIEHELAAALAADAELPPPARGRVSRQLKNFPISPEVDLRADDKGAHHYLNIVAGDRPGLLYRIARILVEYGIRVHTAKINTLGERAEDTFQVSGEALADPRRTVKLETALVQALQT
jgi:[protein-PII] uridylyltransferase